MAAPAQPSIDISFNINNNNDNDNPKNKMSNISENFITFHFKTFNGCTQKKMFKKNFASVFFFFGFFLVFSSVVCVHLSLVAAAALTEPRQTCCTLNSGDTVTLPLPLPLPLCVLAGVCRLPSDVCLLRWFSRTQPCCLDVAQHLLRGTLAD